MSVKYVTLIYTQYSCSVTLFSTITLCGWSALDALYLKAVRYINETLGISAALEPYSIGGLPSYLQMQYQYYRGELLGFPCLFMESLASENSVGELEKHCQAVRKIWGVGEVIYMARAIAPHSRKRLIQHKVAFVVPQTQMFIPALAIDLREYFNKLRDDRDADQGLSPTAQLVVLWSLLKHPVVEISSSKMAERLGCSRVAAGRAYDELAAFKWVSIEKSGGDKKSLTIHLRGSDLWEAIRSHLQSPIRKTRWVMTENHKLPGIVAGESAVSEKTLLGDPKYPVRAIAADEWKGLQKVLELKELKYPEPGCFQLQTWRYSPDLFAKNGVADPLSVYLSLQKESDPRVSMAADALLEHIQW